MRTLNANSNLNLFDAILIGTMGCIYPEKKMRCGLNSQLVFKSCWGKMEEGLSSC